MKQKFFIDFDDTIVNSSRSFCETYSLRYKDKLGFIEPNYKLNKQWDFLDQCPMLKSGELVDIFQDESFFELLKTQFYCQDILEKWQDKYEYYLVSIGTRKNLQHKIDYVDKHFPMIKNLILLNTEGLNMSKSVVDMKGQNGFKNLFIDDHQDNLFSTYADVKILFKPNGNKEWNKGWDGLTCIDWLEVDKQLEINYLKQL